MSPLSALTNEVGEGLAQRLGSLRPPGLLPSQATWVWQSIPRSEMVNEGNDACMQERRESVGGAVTSSTLPLHAAQRESAAAHTSR